MKVNIDYIEALNQHFESKFPNKGFFILKANLDTHNTIKAYKKYTLTLYYHTKNNNEIILQYSNTGKVLNGDSSQLEEDTHIVMLKLIYSEMDKIYELGSKSISDTN